MKRVTVLVQTLVIALAFAPMAAQAQSRFETVRTVQVAILDLDLSTDAGRHSLQKRLDRAVKEVCPGRPMAKELSKMSQVKRCRETARLQAAPTVEALLRGRRAVGQSITVAGSQH